MKFCPLFRAYLSRKKYTSRYFFINIFQWLMQFSNRTLLKKDTIMLRCAYGQRGLPMSSLAGELTAGF
jgi:hypothetical protein